MIRYRPFLNSDSPLLVELWRNQPPLRGRLSSPTPPLLEQHLFSKPYFDPAGLIVGFDGERLVGFVHAGFQPGIQAGDLDRQSGLICMLMVAPDAGHSEIGQELVTLAEQYLVGQGAREIRGGAVGLCSPFYLGLYGGSSLPGVLIGDQTMTDAMNIAGYTAHHTQIIACRKLTEFRPPIDRTFIQLRRQMKLVPSTGIEPTCWQESCIRSWTQCHRFSVVPAGSSETALLTFDFWDVEPLSSEWGVRTTGLLNVQFEGAPRADVLICFLGETARYFQEHGIGLMEIQLGEGNSLLSDAVKRLGFEEVDRGIQFQKSA